jgi:hypothetical protein
LLSRSWPQSDLLCGGTNGGRRRTERYLFQWQANLWILEVHEIKTVPYVPLLHPFVEMSLFLARSQDVKIRAIGLYRGSHCVDGQHDLD